MDGPYNVNVKYVHVHALRIHQIQNWIALDLNRFFGMFKLCNIIIYVLNNTLMAAVHKSVAMLKQNHAFSLLTRK